MEIKKPDIHKYLPPEFINFLKSDNDFYNKYNESDSVLSAIKKMKADIEEEKNKDHLISLKSIFAQVIEYGAQSCSTDVNLAAMQLLHEIVS